jgi:hypothetical protein
VADAIAEGAAIFDATLARARPARERAGERQGSSTAATSGRTASSRARSASV